MLWESLYRKIKHALAYKHRLRSKEIDGLTSFFISFHETHENEKRMRLKIFSVYVDEW